MKTLILSSPSSTLWTSRDEREDQHWHEKTRLILLPWREHKIPHVTPHSKKVWLVGLMACGKSSIAGKIADVLDATTVDMDALIVRQQKMSIADIFARIQETWFRELEKQLVGELAENQDDLVIATGWGAPCFHNNMEIMNRSGITVFLDASPEIVAQRTIDDELAWKPTRPIVAGKDLAQRIDVFQKQRENRGPFYKDAKITIKVDNMSLGDIVGAILEHNSMKWFHA